MTTFYHDDLTALWLVKLLNMIKLHKEDNMKLEKIREFLSLITGLHTNYMRVGISEVKYIDFRKLMTMLEDGELLGRCGYLREKNALSDDEIKIVEELTKEFKKENKSGKQKINA